MNMGGICFEELSHNLEDNVKPWLVTEKLVKKSTGNAHDLNSQGITKFF